MRAARMLFLLGPGVLLGLLPSPAARAVEPETHFALELDLEGGTALPVDLGSVELPGYSARVALGGGIQPAGWPLRLQLQAAYARSGTRFPGEIHSLHRTADRLLFGPRLVVPVFGGLSLFVEGLIGPSWVTVDLEGPSPQPTGTPTELLVGYSAGLGLQYRIMSHLSFGLRAEFADEIAEDLGTRRVLDQVGDPGRRVAIAAFLTLRL